MSKTKAPNHLRRDAQKLAYDRTIESINRICDTFGREPDMLSAVSSATMNAAFLMLYCAARVEFPEAEIEPSRLHKIWGEAMQSEFANMIRGFEVAQQMTEEMFSEERKKHAN